MYFSIPISTTLTRKSSCGVSIPFTNYDTKSYFKLPNGLEMTERICVRIQRKTDTLSWP